MDTIKTKEELIKFVESYPNDVVVVRFHASWCAPCHALENTINSFTKDEIDGVKFCSVDVDEADDALVEEYGIRNIPVLVYIKNGLIANKTVGLRTKMDLINIIEEVKSK